jgi:hypothetical protein
VPIADRLIAVLLVLPNVNNLSGASVSNAGDVNGDGLDDLIVGAFLASLNSKLQIGKSYIIFYRR